MLLLPLIDVKPPEFTQVLRIPSTTPCRFHVTMKPVPTVIGSWNIKSTILCKKDAAQHRIFHLNWLNKL